MHYGKGQHQPEPKLAFIAAVRPGFQYSAGTLVVGSASTLVVVEGQQVGDLALRKTFHTVIEWNEKANGLRMSPVIHRLQGTSRSGEHWCQFVHGGVTKI